MITCKLARLLKRKGWSLYRLRKEADVSYPTLLGLSKSKTKMFRADVLEKLCRTLDCQPGDLLVYQSRKKMGRGSPKKK